ncbi:hypothetical protein ES703_120145 [subsurface metagenome]
MTSTITITTDIEKSLGELKVAPDISMVGMMTEGTADLNLGGLQNTFVIPFDLANSEKLMLLSKICEEKPEIMAGIVRILMYPKEDTVDVEPWPVVPKFPEYVSTELCFHLCDDLVGLRRLILMGLFECGITKNLKIFISRTSA